MYREPDNSNCKVCCDCECETCEAARKFQLGDKLNRTVNLYKDQEKDQENDSRRTNHTT